MVQRGRIFYFSRKPSLEPQIMNIGGAVNIKDKVFVRTGPEIETFSISNVKAKGTHSLENMMAALLAAREHGATHEAIQGVMDSFKGLPRRVVYVRRVGGVEFYNDSKATNVHAVRRALNAFDDNVILMMGGKDTHLNFSSLAD